MTFDIYQFAIEFHRMTAKTIIMFGNCILLYAATIPIFALLSTLQEYKIWKKTPTPMGLIAISKCFIFNVVWMVITLIGALALLPMWVGRGFGPSVEKEAHCVVEKLVAILLIHTFFGGVEIVGEENMPEMTLDGVEEGPGPVFVANHCSELDTAAVYYLVKRFKWVAKESVQFIPGPGNVMSLSGHIFIRRTGKNTNCKSRLYIKSDQCVQSGIPMLIFPQGTRRYTENLPFKDGAFKIAIENKCQLVPISIHIPLGVWNSLKPFKLLLTGGELDAKEKITLTVHKGIQANADSDRDELKKQCREAIYSALPSVFQSAENGVSTTKEEDKKLK